MIDRLFDIMQRVGRAFMLPISILPIAGICLGIGSTMTSSAVMNMRGLVAFIGPDTLGHAVFLIILKSGSIIFDNLPLLFAIGVSIGMSKKSKEIAAISSVICYLVMNATINACLISKHCVTLEGVIAENMIAGSVTKILGISTFQTGAFGGIIVGILVAYLNNRFHKIKLPIIFSFFQGNRFIPVISVIFSIPLGILIFFIWPSVQYAIYSMGTLVQQSGLVGTFLYGLGKRAILPFGLHHVFYLPFWQTGMGGTMVINGQVVEGAQNIFFAQLADPSTRIFSIDACRFFSGEFIFMIFGLPGAALAIYDTAEERNKEKIKGILLSSVITCIFTGITEPLEFSFLFVAPILYVLHCVLAGAAYAIAHIFQISIGLTFSGGLMDFIFFGILQGNEKTNWFLVIPFGVLYFFLYFFVFRYFILRWNLPTLGRSGNNSFEEMSQKTQGSVEENEPIAMIIQGLGGIRNIEYVDSCATRLRSRIYNRELYREDLIEKSGSSAIMKKGRTIQIIYGPMAGIICRQIQECMDGKSHETKESIWETSTKIEAKPKDTKVEIPLQSETIYSFGIGQLIPLEDVDDIVFSSGLLGDGFALLLVGDRIYSPVDGIITSVYDTKHAVGIQSDFGADILIHIGIDTVRLQGRAFQMMVDEQQRVKKGDLLCILDKEMILEQKLSITSPLIINNTDSYTSISKCVSRFVEVGEAVIETNI